MAAVPPLLWVGIERLQHVAVHRECAAAVAGVRVAVAVALHDGLEVGVVGVAVGATVDLVVELVGRGLGDRDPPVDRIERVAAGAPDRVVVVDGAGGVAGDRGDGGDDAEGAAVDAVGDLAGELVERGVLAGAAGADACGVVVLRRVGDLGARDGEGRVALLRDGVPELRGVGLQRARLRQQSQTHRPHHPRAAHHLDCLVHGVPPVCVSSLTERRPPVQDRGQGASEAKCMKWLHSWLERGRTWTESV